MNSIIYSIELYQWQAYSNYGLERKHKIDECTILLENETTINLLEGYSTTKIKNNGDPNSQLELS